MTRNMLGAMTLLLSALTFNACAQGTNNGNTPENSSLFAAQGAAALQLLNTNTSDAKMNTGCSITASTTTPKPGEPVTFTMNGADSTHFENSGIITGRYLSVGDLPATLTINAPDTATTYTLSVFTVDGVRTRHNNCEVTLDVAPKGTADIPLPSCQLTSSEDIRAYGEKFTLDWTSTGATSAELFPSNAVGVIPGADVGAGSHELSSWYGDNYNLRVWNANGDSAQCAINIKPDASVNAAPVATDGVFAISASTTLSSGMIATDIENDSLSFNIEAQPNKGLLIITDAATGAFTYTPSPNASGIDSFTFTANDGNADSNTGTIYINIEAIRMQISAALNHSCAVMNDGTITCWGSNGNGKLGNGTMDSSNVPVPVSNITNAIQVSAGALHSCALLRDRTISCWGLNHFGQLGNDPADTVLKTPVPVPNINNAVQVSANNFQTCALLQDGTVRCWGLGNNSQLGDGTTAQSVTPITVANITNAVQITTAHGHSCALLIDGTVRCWGNGGGGQLGNGSGNSSPVPIPALNLTNAVQVSAANAHTCAALSDGTVSCWGIGRFDPAENDIAVFSVPAQIPGISDAVQVSTGHYFSCALIRNGTTRCWGNGEHGELGNGASNDSNTPVFVSNLTNALQISSGDHHSCAILRDGTASCWGVGSQGRLGNGSTEISSVPVNVLFP